ncbi:tripartite transporter large subunit [Desulfosarcina widdelii]|uniref:Tripartite transporter large subunit n=1 Tax=Desulfosarcina widdelii TaxID=947919 RepID=A0A5K7YZN2_9BACT|nr:TRAP transporter large permease subunit [Desulfosarcina widdelii]BBO72641.1 tripartite transporter large subunit [Desulfosarcina widdelii]
MDLGLISLLMILFVLFLLFLGLPIAFGLISVSLVFTAVFWGPSKLSILVSSTYGTMINPTYLAVPLFIFMAQILQFSGITESLFDAIWKWLCGIRGGLSIASIFAITILSAMTGVGATGIFTVGATAYPEMMKRGYSSSLSIGPIPPASALGPLIPPSNIMIILGGLASISIGGLFMGGVIPGLMMSFLFVTWILVQTYIINPDMAPVVPVDERPKLKEKLTATMGVGLPILLISFVLGGIWTGITTPIEGAGVGAFGSIVCAILKRRLTLKSLKNAVAGTLKANAMIMWLLIGGSCYSAFMTASGMASYLSELVLGLDLPPMAIVGVLLFILFVLGMVMDSVAIMMITVPIFFPIVRALNFDLIWFGVIYTIAIIIGYITPPFGYNLFYMRGVLPSNVSTRVIFRSVLPYIPFMVLVLILCMFIPEIISFIPDLLIK